MILYDFIYMMLMWVMHAGDTRIDVTARYQAGLNCWTLHLVYTYSMGSCHCACG